MIVEITMKVVSFPARYGKQWFAIQRIQTNRSLCGISYAATTYWSNGMGWDTTYAYCTLYATRQEAESQLTRLFGE